MNQQNMWIMYYPFQQLQYISYEQMNFNFVLPLEQVELIKNVKNKKIIDTTVQQNQKNQCKKMKIRSKIQSINSQDQSYNIPQKSQHKILQQKVGRNSVSNILRLFVKLLKIDLFREKYEKIKQKVCLDISFKQFNSWIAGIGLKANKYIRIKKIIKGIKSKPHFGKILYLLYNVFQSSLGRPAILTSAKTQSKNITPTLSQVRNIKREISQALNQGYKASPDKNN